MELMSHQIEGYNKFLSFNYKILLAWNMGTGKTVGSLSIVNKLNKIGLIVCPKSLKDQWKDEIVKFNYANENEIFVSYTKSDFIGLNFKLHKFIIIHYEELRFFSILNTVIELTSKYKLLKSNIKLSEFKKHLNRYSLFNSAENKIIEYENKIFDEKKKNKRYIKLNTKDATGVDIYKVFSNIDSNNIVLILDETYKVKNYKADIHIAYKNFITCFNFNYIIALDGTPFYNNVLETYTIVNLIREKCISWEEINKFLYKNYYGKYVSRNLIGFNKLLNERMMYRVNKEDIIDNLPKVSIKNFKVQSDSGLHKIKEDLIYNIGNIFEMYTTLRVMDSYFNIKLLKERGSEKNSDSSIFKEILKYPDKEYIPKEKLEVLDEVLNEIQDKKLIIFTSFTTTAKFIYNYLKSKKCELVYSGVKDLSIILSRFLNGKSQILITTDTLARGFNAPDIDYLINFDLPPSNSLLQQRITRICRINSKNPKLIINIIGDIVEKDILKIVNKKQKQFSEIVDGKEFKEDVSDTISELASLWNIKSTKKSKIKGNENDNKITV